MVISVIFTLISSLFSGVFSRRGWPLLTLGVFITTLATLGK